MDQIKIGKFISSCRKDKNLTQGELAEKLNLSINAISKWERGISLPDYSNIQILCDILGITLNELFAGEHIEKKDIEKQAEVNIISILKSLKLKDKKYKILKLICIIIVIFSIVICTRFILVKRGYITDDNLRYTKMYINGEKNIKGNVDIYKFGKLSIDFDIGVNKYGYAVFKDPKKALKSLKKNYSSGIKLIQKEFNLLPLSNFNYKSYKIYGWQVSLGTEEEQQQARFVSYFMDIYENSFN